MNDDRLALALALEKVDFLAPDRVTDDTSVLTLKNLVFEPLCPWHDGRVGPGLFDRWTRSPDARRWRFHLRENAVFHDGRRCGADDVVGFIDGLLGAVDTFGMAWPYARYLQGCTVRAAEAGCVELVAPEPFADVVDIFSEFYPCRLSAGGLPVLGTGPYRVETFEPGRGAHLRRVGDGAGPAVIDCIAHPRAEDRLRLVEGGGCDAALNLERVDRPLDRHDRLQWQLQPNTLSVMSYLNCSAGVFRSADARRAINFAVDAQAIVDELFGGLGVPASTVVSPFHLGHAEARLQPAAVDADRALRLFDAADAAGAGGPLRLRTPLAMPPKAAAITDRIAAALRALGLDVMVEVEPDRPSYARQLGAKRMGDSAIFDSSPHSTFRVLNDKVSSRVRGTWWQGYDNPEVEAAIARANRSIGDAERAQAYGRCLAALQRDPPWLYLFHPVEVMAVRPGVRGLRLDHKGVATLRA